MKNFDDIFSRKVKEAFDNYNADHLAEDGWNAYVRKHGGSRKRTLLIPLWARAASIIILVTAGALFINRLSDRETGETAGQVAQENSSKQASETTAGKTGQVAQENGSKLASEGTAAKTGQVAKENGSKQASESTPGKTGQQREEGMEKKVSRAGEHTLIAFTGEQQLTEAVNTDISDLKETEIHLEPLSPLPSIAAGMDLPGTPVEIRLTDNVDAGLNLKPGKPLKDYHVLPREKKSTTIMTGFSGMMASVDNAASTSQGVSIGFYVEQQLSRRISVRPGLAMARHYYSMESSPGGQIAFDYAAPELNGLPAATTSYAADINIVSMEIPVNFVFSIWKRPRTNLFVSTGASTLIYLSQNLSGSFNNTYTRTTVDSNSGSVSYETMTTTTVVESEQEFLNRVDLLGLANFSAGYSLPFGKTTHLLFEPFVQLPLKDLTSLNLRIRYGGLSMKIQF